MLYNPKTFEDFFRPGNIEYLKVYLVLYFCGFSTPKELEYCFNISSCVIKKALAIMEREQRVRSFYIYSGQYVGLEVQEILRKSNAAFYNKIDSNPKLFTLSGFRDENPFEIFKDRIADYIIDSESLCFTMKLIVDRRKALKEFIKICDDREELRESLGTICPHIQFNNQDLKFLSEQQERN